MSINYTYQLLVDAHINVPYMIFTFSHVIYSGGFHWMEVTISLKRIIHGLLETQLGSYGGTDLVNYICMYACWQFGAAQYIHTSTQLC